MLRVGHVTVTADIIVTTHLSSSPPSVLTPPTFSTHTLNHILAKQMPNVTPAATWG